MNAPSTITRLAPNQMTDAEKARGVRSLWELSATRQAEVKRGVVQEQRPVSAALRFWLDGVAS